MFIYKCHLFKFTFIVWERARTHTHTNTHTLPPTLPPSNSPADSWALWASGTGRAPSVSERPPQTPWARSPGTCRPSLSPRDSSRTRSVRRTAGAGSVSVTPVWCGSDWRVHSRPRGAPRHAGGGETGVIVVNYRQSLIHSVYQSLFQTTIHSSYLSITNSALIQSFINHSFYRQLTLFITHWPWTSRCRTHWRRPRKRTEIAE